jgi:ribosome maturation factor RimP
LFLRRDMGALEEVRHLAEAVARRRSLRLWDVEIGGGSGRAIVRVFVDADDGVDLDTVADVSEELSRGLDLRDPLPGRYTLEVSSPGLERTLRSPEHFRLSAGRNVVVKTREPVVGTSNRVDGVIVDATEQRVRLDVGNGESVEVAYDDIKSARTVFEWS